MKRNSTTIFIEAPGSVIPVPWISNAPDFTGFTDPTLSVLQSTWASYTGPIEVISDPLSGWDGGSAETQLPSISLNGVTIFAAPNPSLYPTERPNGQPLIAGDIVWDALAQDWVRWDGSEWNSEIKAIVKSDGLGGYIINYDFRTATEPTIRPDGLAIQDGDRWEKPGDSVYYRSGTEWVSSSLVFEGIQGNVNYNAGMVSYTAGVTPSAYYIAPSGNKYWRLTTTKLQYSNNFGASWIDYANHNMVMGTPVRMSLYVANDESFFICGWLAGSSYYSFDGVTWTQSPSALTNDVFGFEDINGDIYVIRETSLRKYAPGDPSTLVESRSSGLDIRIPPVVLNDGSWVAIQDSSKDAYISYDKGASWSLLFAATYNNSFRDSNGRLYLAGNSGNTFYSDNLVDLVDTNVAGSRFIDSNGAFVRDNLKSINTVSSVSYSPRTIVGKFFVPSIDITYYIQQGNAENHNASNYFTVFVRYTNSATAVVSDYSVVLNDPYPTLTPVTVSIPINELALAGVVIQVTTIAAAGAPSPISVSVLTKATRLL